MVLEFLMFKFGMRAFIGGLIVAVTCASLGVFIVLRRLSLISDGLGHVAFGGIALGFWTGIYPLYTAVASVIAGALGIHALGRLRVASDAAIAILFSGGLAIGIVLISMAQSAPADLLSYLFGTILGINDNDVYLAAGLGVIVLVVLCLLWKEWVGITIDPDFARVAGMPVSALEILFTVLVGLTVVVATRLVGVLLVSSLMVIPAIAAIQLRLPFRRTIFAALAIAIASVIIGLQLSFSYNLASGGAIVIVTIGFFVLTASFARLWPKMRRDLPVDNWKHQCTEPGYTGSNDQNDSGKT
ncbi:MAG: metal ABC transporter permease [Methanoregula sp.]|jgi:zinc transport system permease protein|uniref:metal ABC transporter permease n=1 Tax=Methanoregula sp. TaxID=2052170 RepID=UPI003D13D7EB